MLSKKNIFYGSQFVDSKDILEVSKALRSKHLSSGNYVSKFEISLKKRTKAKYAFVTNSGTSALLVAYLAINLNKNDAIIMPAINFVAAANMALSLKAKIYFADVDYDTGQLTPESVEKCIKKNNIKKIKAIVTMYLGGYPRNIYKFYKLKKKYKFFLIEDACHAFGASYLFNKKTYQIGSCKHSDLCTFSFHPLKTITTGEGGAITTNNSDFAKKIRLIRSHGLSKRVKNYWHYFINTLGYNFRLSDINSALGYSQLKKINKFIKKRKNIYEFYYSNLENYKNIVKVIKTDSNTFPAYHLVIILIDFKKLFLNKDKFLNILVKNNINCQYHYIPNFYFKNFKLKRRKDFDNSLKYFQNAISIPVYYSLRNKDLKKIVHVIKKTIDKFVN